MKKSSKPKEPAKKEEPLPRQQSVPVFTDEEMPLIEMAMKVEAMKSQGQWVKRAAIIWARQVVMSDPAKLQKAIEEILTEHGVKRPS